MYCNAFSRTVQPGLLSVKSTLHVLCNTCSLVRSQCNMNIEIRRLNLVFCLNNVLKQIKRIIWGKQRQGYRSNYVKKIELILPWSGNREQIQRALVRSTLNFIILFTTYRILKWKNKIGKSPNTGSRSTFELPRRVNLSGPSLYCT